MNDRVARIYFEHGHSLMDIFGISGNIVTEHGTIQQERLSGKRGIRLAELTETNRPSLLSLLRTLHFREMYDYHDRGRIYLERSR